MAFAQHPPLTGPGRIASGGGTPGWSSRGTSPVVTRRRRAPANQPLPPLGFVAEGGAAVFRVAGQGLLDTTDDLVYAGLDRADRLAARSGPLALLGLAQVTAARVAYAASSDLAHELLTGT